MEIMLQRFICQINAILLNFLFIKETGFQHDNNKCLEQKIRIRIISEGTCDWTNDAKNSALKLQNELHNIIYIYIQIESSYLNGKNIHNITNFAVFWIK